MVPSSYKSKNTNSISVCKTCDFLATAFRHALLGGRYNHALKIYKTGNINLRCPFTNVDNGSEIMLPIHAAASSGNLELFRWLVDIHQCQIQITTSHSRGSVKATAQLLKTSEGRTIVDIALQEKRLNILQYLCKQKNISLSSCATGKADQNSFRVLEMVLISSPSMERSDEDEKITSSNSINREESNDEGNVVTLNERGDTYFSDCSSYDTDESPMAASPFDELDQTDDAVDMNELKQMDDPVGTIEVIESNDKVETYMTVPNGNILEMDEMMDMIETKEIVNGDENSDDIQKLALCRFSFQFLNQASEIMIPFPFRCAKN